MQKKHILYSICMLWGIMAVDIGAKAQETHTVKDSITIKETQFTQGNNEQSKVGKVKIVPLPVIASNPTIGFAYGVAPGLNWYMGSESNTRMSSALVTVVYTTLNQLFTSVRANTFLEGDKWNLVTDLRFQIASQPTYGLGTQRNPQNLVVGGGDGYSESKYLRENQMMKYNFGRIHFTGLKRHEDTQFYYGLGYHYDVFYNIDDKLLDLESEPRIITQKYRYNQLKNFSNETNTLSGVSVNLLYDSRDNIVNPYHGRYALATLRMNPKWLGSDQGSSILWTEYRDYFNLSKKRPRHMLAWWTYGWFVTGGNVPYMNLPAIGWDMFSRSGRGYTFGRFRGEDLVYSELEYRFPLMPKSDLLGGVVFVNAATASSRTEDIPLFGHVNVAYGVGLRVMINKKGRNNLCIDYGRSTNGSSGIFVQLNETF